MARRVARLFILAGEPSGDRIAADLVRRLRSRVALELSGVGGIELIGEGLVSLYPMADLSVMGVRDVVARLPLLLWRIAETARRILAIKPDVVVLVDAQEFSTRLARRLRRAGFKGPVLLYVAPSVWGRAPERAARLKPLFNEVLAVFPFEPAVMARLGGPPTHYVGHPALGEVAPRAEGACIDKLALLPGSRPGELRRHLPLLKGAVAGLAGRADVGEVFLPTLGPLAAGLARETADWARPITIVTDRAHRLALYGQTRAAITTAGTATLEVALADVPMVVTYVMERAQAKKFAELGRPFVGLPNIIANADVTPEIIIEGTDPGVLLAAVEALMDDNAMREGQHRAFARLRVEMEEGLPEGPRQDPADRVMTYLEGIGQT